jgi:acyl-[acyl-carrier-protein]-phospholipid O-acyltransferase/long-chain-fatty-acid--[acyl-carrier-protein] ligase
MLIATRHGSAAIAALIVAVALAAWAASWGIPHTSPAARRAPARWNLVAATARVIHQAASERLPFRAMLAISWFWVAGAVYLSQFPGYVRFILGAEEAVVTLFLTLFSVGIAVGSLLCNRLLRGDISTRLVPWGALGIGLFSIDFWLASPQAANSAEFTGLATILADPSHWRILADLFGIAASGGVFVVPLYALLQAATVREHRARVIAANNVINAAAMVASSAATMALLAGGLSIPGIFLLTGGATIAVAAACRRLFA